MEYNGNGAFLYSAALLYLVSLPISAVQVKLTIGSSWEAGREDSRGRI